VSMTGAALLALIFTWIALRQIRIKRLIENLPTSPIRAISCGLTETCGEIHPIEGDALLTTPHFGTQCLWYVFKREEKRGSGKNTRWHTLEKEVRCLPFYLRD